MVVVPHADDGLMVSSNVTPSGMEKHILGYFLATLLFYYGYVQRYFEFGVIDMGKTARELSIEELRTYRPLQALDDFQKDPIVAERRERAWKVARVAADLLKTGYGATRVVVFGSLALKTPFTPWSDIDLAVWGIKPEQYFSAAGAAMDMGLDSGIKVDLVDPENCSKEFQADIEVDGIEV